MAQDATGTPTSLGIPTYDVNADAPTGVGLNAIVGVIDTLIAARVPVPGGKAAGDVPVWNGSSWVVPGGTRDGTKFLRDDGTWAFPANLTLASSVGTFTGENHGSDTAITLDAVVFDDIGSVISLVNAYSTLATASKYLVTGFGLLAGQSGSGSGHVRVERQNSSGVTQEVLADVQVPFNAGASWSAVGNFSSNDRVVVFTSNGATGSAGTMSGRLSITKLTS